MGDTCSTAVISHPLSGPQRSCQKSKKKLHGLWSEDGAGYGHELPKSLGAGARVSLCQARPAPTLCRQPNAAGLSVWLRLSLLHHLWYLSLCLAFTGQQVPTRGRGSHSHRALSEQVQTAWQSSCRDRSVSALKHAWMGRHTGPTPATDLEARRMAARRLDPLSGAPTYGWTISSAGAP